MKVGGKELKVENTNMLKVAITGANGLIGSRIIELLNNDFQFIDIPQTEVDITDEAQVINKMKSIDFDIFLHLAAYTNVDASEINKEIAYKVNVEGTKNIFKAIADKGKKMIYISTDFVFDGQTPPYYEDSNPNPISYYGMTKYEGEKAVKDQAMIIRLSYPYRAKFDIKKDLVKTIRSFLEEKKSISMVKDSLITPTFIDDIVYALKFLMNNFSNAIYHINGADALSPYETALTIAKVFNLDSSLIKNITYEEYFKDKAKRPRFSDMKSKKNNFYKMKTFEEGLIEIKKQIEN